MLGEQVLTVGEKQYSLRLSFDATRRIEQTLNKSLIHIDALSLYEMSVALSACTDMTTEEAFEAIKLIGIETVSVAVKTLIVETYNPAKKPLPAAKKQKD